MSEIDAPVAAPSPLSSPALPSPSLASTPTSTSRRRSAVGWLRARSAPICLSATLAGVALYTALFATLGIRHHRNFGTWSFDMAIYDQAFWLVSRGGRTFMTMRGLDVWGHHVNLIAYVFAPFYRLGAGPEFLYVVQSFGVGLGALPVYLIANRRFARPTVGLAFAIAYLMYAPVEFITWINFHPEALIIAPFLFAWYFAQKESWRWYFVALFVALIMREDVALAIVMLGLVLGVRAELGRHRGDGAPRPRRDALLVPATTVWLGVTWYLLATQVIIPHFNNGEQAFYVDYFFREYGGSLPGVARTILRHPDWVVRDATKPDRIRFYRDLALPLGGLPLASPLTLLMAAPQMLASVIGSSVYARQILYQYTSVMIAPVVIAGIEGAHSITRRWAVLGRALVPWLLVCAYVTNVAWSPSPIGTMHIVWANDNPRAAALQAAVDLVPDGATVSSSYNLGPHLSRRRESYDWPNPFWPAYWGQADGDCRNFPSPSEVDYLLLDRSLYQGDPAQVQFIDGLTAPDGEFEVVFDTDDVMVAERVKDGPGGEALAPNCPGTNPVVATVPPVTSDGTG